MNDSNINQTPGGITLNGHTVNNIYNNKDRLLHLAQYMNGSPMTQNSNTSKEEMLEDFESFSNVFSFDCSNKKDNSVMEPSHNTDGIFETTPTAPPIALLKPVARSYRDAIIPESLKQPFHDPCLVKHEVVTPMQKKTLLPIPMIPNLPPTVPMEIITPTTIPLTMRTLARITQSQWKSSR
jgi:hypothetical protein